MGATGPGDEFVADHEVRLDTGCWQFEAFTGLAEYLRWHASPDWRIAHEAEIVADVGAWIGERASTSATGVSRDRTVASATR